MTKTQHNTICITITANNTAKHEDKVHYNKMQCIITHSTHEAVRYG